MTLPRPSLCHPGTPSRSPASTVAAPLVPTALAASTILACGGSKGGGTCVPGSNVSCTGPGSCLGHAACKPDSTPDTCVCDMPDLASPPDLAPAPDLLSPPD